ncbi:hypothetical protein B0H17DRAFT_1330940 [Mycena rosella]|uniref:Uncharacterized protein n=1 Tax=Mycena rosella TaxID=1033263 RepID=A0AAD7DKZ9_MYCRO|nr:hypothetical protein B0H17DRAFT_1330940 [Mycena rosella]
MSHHCHVFLHSFPTNSQRVPMIAVGPITWYDRDGNVKEMSPALDEFVHGENAYSLAHLELKPTTWDVCQAYFDTKLTKKNGIQKIESENQYWCWILPLKMEGDGKLVSTTSVQKLHVPFPIETGKGATLPAYGAPPTLFHPDRQVVDPSLTGSSLPMTTGIIIVKSSPEAVVDGLISYWHGNGKDMDEDYD